MFKSLIAPALFACAAASTLTLSPIATADEPGCVTVQEATVCANSEETAAPPIGQGAGAANDQNGTYGPSGDKPPWADPADNSDARRGVTLAGWLRVPVPNEDR